MREKTSDCIVAGTIGGVATIVGGIFLFTNPAGWAILLGTTLISAGLGGVGNTVSQYRDPNKDKLDYGQYWSHVGANGAIGFVTAGIGSEIAAIKVIAELEPVV